MDHCHGRSIAKCHVCKDNQLTAPAGVGRGDVIYRSVFYTYKCRHIILTTHKSWLRTRNSTYTNFKYAHGFSIRPYKSFVSTQMWIRTHKLLGKKLEQILLLQYHHRPCSSEKAWLHWKKTIGVEDLLHDDWAVAVALISHKYFVRSQKPEPENLNGMLTILCVAI